MSKLTDWLLKPINSRNVIITILFLFSIIVIILAVYGSVRIYTLQEKFNTIKAQQVKITELEEKIRWLRQINELSLVLEQMLIPLQINELRILNERVRQNKYRLFKKPVKEKKCLD